MDSECGVKGKARSSQGHFVLVHGAGFGAWCWYKVANMLIAAGHKVSALDMASGGIDPRDADHISTLAEYNQPLTDFFRGLPSQNKVILVGHSAGGFDLTFTMEQFPHKIGAAVFVTATMPLSGKTLIQSLDEIVSYIGSLGDTEYYYARGKEYPATSVKFGKTFLRERMLQKSPPWDLTLTYSLLKKYPLWEGALFYTKENYGSVPRVYVVAKEDKLILEVLQRKYIAENPPQEVYEMEGSDHSTFFSKPDRLTQILMQIAHEYLCD